MIHYTIGAGAFTHGAKYSELKNLIEEGYDALQQHGVASDLLRIGARIYARVFRQHRQQCGSACKQGKLHDELLQRVLNELDESTLATRRTLALSVSAL